MECTLFLHSPSLPSASFTPWQGEAHMEFTSCERMLHSQPTGSTEIQMHNLHIQSPICYPFSHYISMWSLVSVMLLTLKEDNTTGSFYICCLLHVFSMILSSGEICTSMLYIKLLLVKVTVCFYIHLLFVQMTLQYICVLVSYWLHM